MKVSKEESCLSTRRKSSKKVIEKSFLFLGEVNTKVSLPCSFLFLFCCFITHFDLCIFISTLVFALN